MATATNFVGSYSQLASEYYDAKRHPTCANFREASAAILRSWFSDFVRPGISILETGAGASIVDELTNELKLQVALILSDQSPEMLSKTGRRSFDRHLISDAEQLSIRNHSVDAIAASLGDPYNTMAFWRECARVLRPGGRIFFTTPSFNWAHSFRGETSAPLMAAEFALAQGGTLLVPSVVLKPTSQVELIRSAGLEVEQVMHIDTSDIRHTRPSPKLRPGALVTGYRVASHP
jgi:ubiquinone/menaquinone biosynthesis C-methylase UbiE